jgi:hypothetical protein
VYLDWRSPALVMLGGLKWVFSPLDQQTKEAKWIYRVWNKQGGEMAVKSSSSKELPRRAYWIMLGASPPAPMFADVWLQLSGGLVRMPLPRHVECNQRENCY